MAALDSWPRRGLPENPTAWLYRVALNQLAGALRGDARRRHLLESSAPTATAPSSEPLTFLANEVPDDVLGMLFVCCDEAIPEESQLVLALKTLCGFEVREISLRLFKTEANVYKRLLRARAALGARAGQLDELLERLDGERLASRLPAVHAVLYVLFTEGYLSSRSEAAIRRELCDEAIRLTSVLARHPVAATPETFSLLALMHLHRSRMTARQDACGGLILLEEQDRTLFDAGEIRVGLEWLERSAAGDLLSRYHLEAGIAAEHCLARTFRETHWERVTEYYALLETVTSSPVHRLNRAIAVAEWRGPEAGLGVLKGLEPPSWLEGSHLWNAVLADLHRRSGDGKMAMRHREIAIATAPTEPVRDLLQRRLGVSTPPKTR
jgi:RNA polymerase sigma-70 factor (ECF subfamily)